MSRLGNIRDALADNLEASFGTSVQVSAYALSQPNPPAIQIVPGEIRFDQAMGRGLDHYDFTVTAMVPFNEDQGMQQLLDRMLDPEGADSIKAALESNRTLGGLADDLIVTSSPGYRVLLRPTNETFLTADFMVTVWVTP